MTDTESITNNFPAAEATPVAAAETEFHQVDLGCKETVDNVDKGMKKFDVEANNDKVDSLYKGDQIEVAKQVTLHRRKLYNLIAFSIGLIALIVLVSTLRKPKRDSLTKKDSSTEDRAPGYDTKSGPTSNYSDTSIPQFSCANTITSCSAVTNASWMKLPDDVMGESQNDYAGFATALSCDGSILAVSSIRNNNRTGHVSVYKWENDLQSWMKLGNDIDGNTPDEEFGYSLTMSADGNKIAVGSRKNSDKAVHAGEVLVFSFSNNLWIQFGQDIQGEFAGDQLGRSISLSMDGSRIAIGASHNNGTASGAGHARIFEISEINGEQKWVQLGQDLDGETMGDQFGRSISISGDGRRVAVGGSTYDTVEGISDAGHVRVFDFDSTAKTWMQVSDAITGQRTDEYFGVSVSLSYDGGRLAIGSPDSDPFIFGFARVYELTINGWSQLGSNLFGGGHTIDLTLDGSRIVIGSKGSFVNGIQSGHMSVYDYDVTTSSWSQVGSDIYGEEGEHSATSVAISADGKRIVSSAPNSGIINGTEDNGIVRVYDFC